MMLIIEGQLTGNLGEALAEAARLMRVAYTNAQTLAVGMGRLDKAWQSSEGAFDEGAQKLQDLRNRADEFGASIEEQRQLVDLAARAAENYNKPLAITARFLEELTIETQDASKAMGLMDKAMAHAARNSLRVEDAVAEFVDLVNGRGVQALERFGAEGRAAAEAIARIEDPQARARAGLAAWERLSGRQAGTLGRVNAALLSAQGALETFVAQLGPAGVVMGVGAVAALGLGLALGGAVVSGALSAAKALAEVDKTVGSTAKRVEQEWTKLKAAVAGALFGGGDQVAGQLSEISRGLQEATRWVNENRDAIRDLVETGIYVAAEAFKVLYHTGIEPNLLGLAVLADSVIIPARLFGALGGAALEAVRVFNDFQNTVIAAVVTPLLKLNQAMGELSVRFVTAIIEPVYRAGRALLDFQNQINSATVEAVRSSGVWQQLMGAMERMVEGAAAVAERVGKFLVTSFNAVTTGFKSSMGALSLSLSRVFGPAVDWVSARLLDLGELSLKLFSALAEAFGLDKILAAAKQGLSDLARVGERLGQQVGEIFDDSATVGVIEFGQQVDQTTNKVRDFVIEGGKGKGLLRGLSEEGKGLEDRLREVEERMRQLSEATKAQAEMSRLLSTGTSGEVKSALQRMGQELEVTTALIQGYTQEADKAQATDKELSQALRQKATDLQGEQAALQRSTTLLKERHATVLQLEAIEGAQKQAQKEREEELQAQIEQAAKTTHDLATKQAEETKQRMEALQRAYEQTGQAALQFGNSTAAALGKVAAGASTLESFKDTLVGGVSDLFGNIGGALFGAPGSLAGNFLGGLFGGLFGQDDRDSGNRRLERAGTALERAANAFLASQERERQDLYVTVTLPGTTFDRAVQTSVRRGDRRGEL
jgi:hypothetical protein